MKKCSLPTVILAAFAGTGKTMLASKYANVLDLESSVYKYDYSNMEPGFCLEHKKGCPLRPLNPDFPRNYIQAIKENMGKYDYVLTRCDLEKLIPPEDKDLIQPIFVLPHPDAWHEVCLRYRARGNTETWIFHMSNIWNERLRAVSATHAIYLNTGENLESYLLHSQFPQLVPKPAKECQDPRCVCC